MKSYIKKAIKELNESDKLTIEVELKKPNDYKRRIRGFYNKFIYAITGRIPPNFLKNFLIRTTGVKLSKDVCIPMFNEFDPYYPELITLEDGVLVGGLAKIFSHKVVGNKLILGKIKVEQRVLVGGESLLFPGAYIHKNSILGLGSDLDTEVEEGTLYGGKPAKLIIKFSSEQLEKYFGRHPNKDYYKDAKKKIKEFKKSQENIVMIPYKGKRLNAGLDWWKARNIFKIFIDGGLIEGANFLPNFMKILIFKLLGAKIGKNVKIGYNTRIDHIYPEYVSIGDNTTIGKNCYIDAHEYTITLTRFGRTRIGKNVKMGNHVLVRSGIKIGDNVTILPNSAVMKDVPDNVTIKGSPAKVVE